MAADATFTIEKRDDGTHVGHYGDNLLQTAFQPVFRFSGGRLAPVACEALLRVSRGETPVVTDAFFNGIDADTARAIEPQLRRLHILNAKAIPSAQRRLFLNFDPRAIAGVSTLAAELRDLGADLRLSDIPPSNVVCEVTESEAPNDEALRHFAYELRARGYLIAVDDFGAEASRMKRVRAIAPDIVKLDGKLVRDMLETPAGFGTLQLMIQRFAKDGIDVVLEGVESMWQVDLAARTGAAFLQGFAVAAPRIVGPHFADWLAQYALPPATGGETLVKRFK